MSIPLVLACGFVLLAATLVAFLRSVARTEGFFAVLAAGLVVVACGYLGAHLLIASIRAI